jgi:hypothetical protein
MEEKQSRYLEMVCSLCIFWFLYMSNTIDTVVTDGVRFLQSLTEHFGAERGLEIWEQFGSALGTDIKGRVFFALMTGNTTGRVRFSAETLANGYNPNAIGIIKAIRTATGAGLKEAKDLYDNSKLKAIHVDCPTPEQGRRLANELRDLGCRVF